jgi:hypothetical protein
MQNKSSLPTDKEYQAGYGESYVVFPFQIQRVEGKILTLIESLGLSVSQEKASKDLARDIVQGLYRDTEYLNGSLTTIIVNEKYILKANGEFKDDGIAPQYNPPFN